ncbi:hypothetical protein A2982_01015 [candidate division WWE3 bacterium RIFCSPLOWO2_01_FULL_39_13]|uniref:Glyoxalase-like domain-containing protein n=1 Tax=candidate division WWE3 bacterium RIFCSPLOWO2_01_FULL_39_13 TaxID=1802624 RepID=A0A1F4V5D7_UNCKA|nr:MAG: hypothetical protein A2982_01015 [candidate division WWE3 bacterium RIFCSPLOWO2_01_FULL_39_13]
MKQEARKFLDKLFYETKCAGIDIEGLKIDHVAFSTASTNEYERLLPKFLNKGKLIKEALVSDRRVAIIKLKTPIIYKQNVINVIELVEPISGEPAESKWEHAEFLVTSYDELLNKYQNLKWDTKHKNRVNFSRIKLTLQSGIEVKFLDTPVLVNAGLED